MIPREILRNVRRIEITTKGIVDAAMSGRYHSAFKGRGIEFSEVRPYADGDDIRTIDWNVTARMGEPYIKKHVEERELTVMLVVDASASGEFGSAKRFKRELAVELCAVLAFSAIRNNDRVGLLIFTSDVELFLPPRKGKNHVLRLIRELLCFSPRGRGTSIRTALQYLNRIQRKRAVVFVLSDFFDKGYEQALRVTARRHDCIAMPINDPREEQLPNVGFIELEDPETGQLLLVDTADARVRHHVARTAAMRHEALHAMLRSTGIDTIALSTAEDYVPALLRFFARREKATA